MCDRTVRSPKSPIFIQKWPTCTWNEPNMCDRTVRLIRMSFIVSLDSFILLTWLIYEIFVSWLYRVWGSGMVPLGMVAGIYHYMHLKRALYSFKNGLHALEKSPIFIRKWPTCTWKEPYIHSKMAYMHLKRALYSFKNGLHALEKSSICVTGLYSSLQSCYIVSHMSHVTQ